MGYQLNTDGGSRGNPGNAGCGFVLTHDGEPLLSAGWHLGRATNNYAEYCALIWGLENALAFGVRELSVRADSELMIKQMNGVYKVKNPDMKKLYARATRLVAQFAQVDLAHVYREDNKEADARANEAMDAQAPVGEYLVGFSPDEDASGTASLFPAAASVGGACDEAADAAALAVRGATGLAARKTGELTAADGEQVRNLDVSRGAGALAESDVERPLRKRFAGKTVLVGVTGCIAAYKACYLVRCLQKAAPGLNVKVVMTEHATAFVGPTTFRALTGNEVAVGLFDNPSDPIHHISLAKEADVFCIAPATANVIAKIATGVADDLLTTTALATKAPLVIAPAMNAGMWSDAATQQNIAALLAKGTTIVGPADGYQACGDIGTGRMEEPQVIAEEVLRVLARSQDLAGKRVLVTAGPTHEPLDPVRYLSNRSSGTQGYAVAAEAAARGAQVTLVTGPVALATPEEVELVRVTTALEMLEACRAPFAQADIAVFVAAVADWRPERVETSKIKHDGSDVTVHLVPNPDIAATLAADKGATHVVVFAAETDDVIAHAKAKLEKKNADLVVANDVSGELGFGTADNHVWFVSEGGVEELPTASKRAIAGAILDRVK